jgi:hypothetical protein
MKDAGFIWLASYPKSGNTYVRHLIEAYRCNGALDINNVRSSVGDGGATLVRNVSSFPLENLGFRGEALLRPAALLNYYSSMTRPKPLIKTHWANLTLKGLPPFIPEEFTHSAIYVVRDPRDVFTSCCNYFQYPPQLTAKAMASKEFTVGGDGTYARCMVSSWSNNVASWVGEDRYPVHIVKYEDVVADPKKELTEILELLDIVVKPEQVDVAVNAVSIDRIQKQESENGFVENSGRCDKFFDSGGGSRWRDEVGPRWAKQIERDHGEIMTKLGYE